MTALPPPFGTLPTGADRVTTARTGGTRPREPTTGNPIKRRSTRQGVLLNGVSDAR